MPLSAALASATLIKTAGSSVFRSILPHLLDPYTQRKTLNHLHAELLEYCTSTEQANDLYNRIKDEPFLKRIARMTTVEEVHREVGAVIHPRGATDPQREEAMILTRALLSALLRATSPGTNTALTNSMILHSYLKDSLPGFSEMLYAHRSRQEHPGESAKADLADLLARAGQSNMGIEIYKDRPAQVVGHPRIHLQFGGQNAELFHQWIEGGHGASLTLQAENGELNLSFGHPELDRLLFPEGHKATQLEISEVKTEFQARVRVSASDEPDVFVPITLGIAPHSKEIEVKFGADKCFIWFTLAPLKSGDHHISIQLQLGGVSQVLPIEYRSVLRAMRLLGRHDMHVFLQAGTEFVRPDGTSIKVEKDTALIDGRIWQARNGTETPWD
ncbi:hypothetical protein [Deinococcus humi]|uniref:Uncharacterized protein n=1 Tax=Deinococcus humi TaxID=662880 RepID=A0A7W8JZA5_9DEIO|nr:hypothetical protein [Deinococcus humi]MBB5365967.1 hypothetical protein [Deinococcus humi]